MALRGASASQGRTEGMEMVQVTQAVKDTWVKFINCDDDRTFGNRTRMDKQLEVLAQFEAQTLTQAQAETAALLRERDSAHNANQILAEGIAQKDADLAALLERCERLQAVADRIQKRHSEWQEAIVNWTGALSMTKAQAEAAAAEMEWADFLIRSKANHDG